MSMLCLALALFVYHPTRFWIFAVVVRMGSARIICEHHAGDFRDNTKPAGQRV